MDTPKIKIQVDDPWDLGEAIGWREIPGVVVKFFRGNDIECALILLDEPISYHGTDWQYLVAKPGSKDESIRRLDTAPLHGCAMIGVANEFANMSSGEAAELSRWRGGLAFIGDISPR